MNPNEKALLSVAKRHMATDFDLEIVVENRPHSNSQRIGESVLAESHALLEKLEDELTEFRSHSPVYRLNRAVPSEWIEVSESLSELLELSRAHFEETGGAFTPFARSPYAATFSDLEIDRPARRFRRKRTDLQLGFGAIGKGYALDRVAAFLDREGFSDYRLGAGGSSWVFRGFHADDRPWEIAWAWTRDVDGDWSGHSYRLPGGRPIAIGVSGTAEKGQHFYGGGASIAVDIQSAFCSARSAAEADALSTALIVGATRDGENFLTKFRGGSEGIRELGLAYVDLDSQMFYNQTFNTLFLREGRNPK